MLCTGISYRLKMGCMERHKCTALAAAVAFQLRRMVSDTHNDILKARRKGPEYLESSMFDNTHNQAMPESRR